MTPAAIWSSEAQADLDEVALYIGVHEARPVTAERIVREVHELCNVIASQPEMGESRPEFGTQCRIYSFKRRWVILYRPATSGIEVLRFVDGARDYDRLFRRQ